ncbi:polymorphic toxin-type HINT domain-containing protein [Luteimicrobium sp. DT211]|uniref:polymorphic toxin-type HINT domain-containing protein n=1 Tax=Luteimicrobium sp. DT211 TaxID=3393412 RepID=UPI003CF9882D
MRPTDWSPVGLDIDPTPGDPVLVLSGGREYLDVADSIDAAAAAMARLDVVGAVSQAVDALMDRKEDTISEVRKAHARYQAAGEALVSYASTLEQVQSDTLAALQRARGAHADAADAARTEHSYQDLAESETDAATKTQYKHKATTAADGASAAHATIAAAQDDINAAVSTWDRAADSAADQITEITSHDDLNDSWWDNWGSKLVAAIADIADLVSTIAGILAVVVAFIPVVGTALAGVLIVVAAVAAIVSALANIALAATGERSWGEAGIAIAGAALSVIGLGAAAKAATGISKAAFKAGARETMVGLNGVGADGLRGGLKGFGKEPFCKVGFGTCFTAGTLVSTPDGDRPIETLRAGDKVYTFDQASGVQLLETVEETFVRTTTRLFHLTIGGATVTTTAEHPLMVTGMGWVQAADLRPGDLLTTPDGTVTLDELRAETVDETAAVTVYNIHVRAFHTYYVVAGNAPVLVHNMAGHGKVILAEHEAAGGHVIARHVAKSDAYLKSREIRWASSFVDLATAERVIAANMRSNARKIEKWLAGDGPTEELHNTMSSGAGKVYIRARGVFVPAGGVVTVLRRNPAMPEGYHIVTSYPTPLEF